MPKAIKTIVGVSILARGRWPKVTKDYAFKCDDCGSYSGYGPMGTAITYGQNHVCTKGKSWL